MSLILFLQAFWEDLFHTFIEFLYAPIIFKEMLWILIPVALAILLMEFYFLKYPRESIGHHKSLESSIFLLFISFDLLRYLLTHQNAGILKSYIIVAYLVWVLAMVILDFLHKLSTSLVFRLSSKSILAYLSYIVIILIYSDMLNLTTASHLLSIALSIVLLFLTIVVIRKGVAALEPKSYEELEHFLKNIEEDIKKTSEEMNEKPGKQEKKKQETSKTTKK